MSDKKQSKERDIAAKPATSGDTAKTAPVKTAGQPSKPGAAKTAH